MKSFLRNKEISDSKNTTEVLLALQVGSRKEVDGLMELGLAASGKEAREVHDLGFMYGRALEDLDGYILEIFHMDENKMQK